VSDRVAAPSHPSAKGATVIVGGTSGIGLATAELLAREGRAGIVLMGRNAERGAAAVSAVAAVGSAVPGFRRVDAGDPSAVAEALSEVRDTHRHVDTVVCSTAADFRPELLHRCGPDEIVGALRALTEPPLIVTHAALTLLREQGGGCIVTVASDAAKVPTPGEAAIGAAMAAIVMFSRVAALEGKRDNVRVNVVTPSLVAGTPTSDALLADGFSRRLFERAAERAELGIVVPQDVAELIAFLSSPRAAKITGQVLSVNGGVSVA